MFSSAVSSKAWIPRTGSPCPGVREIRVRTALEHRVLYVAKFVEAVYVVHAFEKRTRKTSTRDLELARQRFRALLAERRARDMTGG